MVIYLLQQAACQQAFRYVRLCMLPVLRASAARGGDFPGALPQSSHFRDACNNLLVPFVGLVLNLFSSYHKPFYSHVRQVFPVPSCADNQVRVRVI